MSKKWVALQGNAQFMYQKPYILLSIFHLQKDGLPYVSIN